jgi:hypothetical protein
MKRVALLVCLAFTVTSCSAFGQASDALSVSPVPTTTSPPGGLGPAPTDAPDGKPAVVIRTPVAGDELVSPIGVSGKANVADGEVTITLLAQDGTPLASTRTKISCGSNCRGTYAADIAFFVEQRVSGTIAVFEVSADDGSAVNVASIPVTLVPGS